MVWNSYSHVAKLHSLDELRERTKAHLPQSGLLQLNTGEYVAAGSRFTIQSAHVWSDLLVCIYLPRIPLAVIARVPRKEHQTTELHDPLARDARYFLEDLTRQSLPSNATPEQKQARMTKMGVNHNVTFWSGAIVGGDSTSTLEHLAAQFTKPKHGFHLLPTPIGEYAGRIFVEQFNFDVATGIISIAYGRRTPLGKDNIPTERMQRLRLEPDKIVSLTNVPSTDASAARSMT